MNSVVPVKSQAKQSDADNDDVVPSDDEFLSDGEAEGDENRKPAVAAANARSERLRRRAAAPRRLAKQVPSRNQTISVANDSNPSSEPSTAEQGPTVTEAEAPGASTSGATQAATDLQVRLVFS